MLAITTMILQLIGHLMWMPWKTTFTIHFINASWYVYWILSICLNFFLIWRVNISFKNTDFAVSKRTNVLLSVQFIFVYIGPLLRVAGIIDYFITEIIWVSCDAVYWLTVVYIFSSKLFNLVTEYGSINMDNNDSESESQFSSSDAKLIKLIAKQTLLTFGYILNDVVWCVSIFLIDYYAQNAKNETSDEYPFIFELIGWNVDLIYQCITSMYLWLTFAFADKTFFKLCGCCHARLVSRVENGALRQISVIHRKKHHQIHDLHIQTAQ